MVQLTTRITGARSNRAKLDVLCVPDALLPSNNPRLPSTMAMSDEAAVTENALATAWASAMNVSRFRQGFPDTHDSQAASI